LLVADRVAQDAVDLLSGIELARLGRCPVEDGGCGWLFLDHSRNRSRRWCTMENCGTGAKATRLTERRRRSRAATRN
jgi:predicted RNA-binding Zn ribbon-like protein